MKTFLFTTVYLSVFCSMSFASTAREIAYARLVICKSIIEHGKDGPELPDSPPRAELPTQPGETRLPPLPGDSQDASDTRSPRDWASQQVAKADYDKVSADLSEQKSIAERLKAEAQRPLMRSLYESSMAKMAPMRLDVSSPKVSTGVHEVPQVQLVVRIHPRINGRITCPPGERQWDQIQEILGPKGWRIGTSSDSHIKREDGNPQVENCPHILLYRNGVVQQEWTQYTDPVLLANATRAAQSISASSSEPAVALSGVGGTIHASSQIKSAIDYFRKYVGTGNQASLTWDRNGDAALNLWAMKQWDAAKIFGSEGRIELDSPDAVNLPVKEMAFGYRIRGSDMTFDGEPVTVRGLADKLRVASQNSAVSEATPVGLIGIDDALMLYSIVCMMRDVIAILQPSADLMLPNQVSATAVLNGDVLTVTFNKAPAIKATWLITIMLTVKQITITEKNVHVDFTGSRFIHSRDIAVE